MSRYSQKILTSIGSSITDSIKGLFGFMFRLIEKNLWIFIVLFAANYALDHKFDFNFLKKVTSNVDTRLKTENGETAKANIYMDRNILIIQQEGKEPKIYSGVREAELVKFTNNEIKVRVKDKGLKLEPGVALAAGDGLRIGLDLEFVYWRRWGAITGLTVPSRRRTLGGLRGHTGISYDLPTVWLSNTSIWAGLDTNKTPILGIRTRF